MPQLDLYTYPTQIFFISSFFFLALLFTGNVLIRLFFRSELLEQERLALRLDQHARNVEIFYVVHVFRRVTYFLTDIFRAAGGTLP